MTGTAPTDWASLRNVTSTKTSFSQSLTSASAWGGFGEIRYLVELFYTKSGISPDFGWSFLTEVLTLTPEQRKQLQLNLKVQLDLHYERRQMIEQVEWESRVSVLREARALLAEQIHLDET